MAVAVVALVTMHGAAAFAAPVTTRLNQSSFGSIHPAVQSGLGMSAP
jgi:hypothetical protein